jgi:hypothetical protein
VAAQRTRSKKRGPACRRTQSTARRMGSRVSPCILPATPQTCSTTCRAGHGYWIWYTTVDVSSAFSFVPPRSTAVEGLSRYTVERAVLASEWHQALRNAREAAKYALSALLLAEARDPTARPMTERAEVPPLCRAMHSPLLSALCVQQPTPSMLRCAV